MGSGGGGREEEYASASRVACGPWRRVFGAGQRKELDSSSPSLLSTTTSTTLTTGPIMDADLIKLVNKLQDTFANLGQSFVFLSSLRVITRDSRASASNMQAESWTCPSSRWYVLRACRRGR